ncbi:hypothetical protein CROQUDRAFT_243177 [Cronartium quercuum f. sp. fusiforme G11]|uniref:Uncharacterized protein n=1 Tax=Cronartium quercuum f. sp. fusiforme G11 TaxID=708437 RepID=A0A9P6N953_9BASI|nr:hypothetical protein CROQUDRAFT_243177 [Cronartium quercuum f. sp. fusiforme G11]
MFLLLGLLTYTFLTRLRQIQKTRNLTDLTKSILASQPAREGLAVIHASWVNFIYFGHNHSSYISAQLHPGMKVNHGRLVHMLQTFTIFKDRWIGPDVGCEIGGFQVIRAIL